MKNPIEVLQRKEQEIQKLRKEVEALRITARLLNDDSPAGGEENHDLRHLVEMP
jgi:hypothetical protein